MTTDSVKLPSSKQEMIEALIAMRPPSCIREKILHGKYDTPQAVKAAIMGIQVPQDEVGQMAAFLTALKSYIYVTKNRLQVSVSSGVLA